MGSEGADGANGPPFGLLDTLTLANMTSSSVAAFHACIGGRM